MEDTRRSRTRFGKAASDFRLTTTGTVLQIAFFVIVMCREYDASTSLVTENTALNYLKQFGYLSQTNSKSGAIIDAASVVNAIIEFQKFAGLEPTGNLNNETLHLMSTPRCGVKDVIQSSSTGRSKRYALQGSRWKVQQLTYKITKYPVGNLAKADVDEDIAKAFAVWSEYTDLVFVREKPNQKVHIEIRFESGEHGDGDPFDGPGGTLAHAYFPVYGGDAHFDAAEFWTINSQRGTNLFQVAAHEFGHSLGLSHSVVRSALMAPFYRGYNPAFMLDLDDIKGIQALYGTKTPNDDNFHVVKAGPRGEADLCKNTMKIDTMFNSVEGDTYVFKGDHYWKLTNNGVASGYPKLIKDSWKYLESNIDAAFTYKNNKTFFFKGSRYWRYDGMKMDDNYPKKISQGFSGIPDNIDAVTMWTGNGKIYFYKGNKFWRFDPGYSTPIKSNYPKKISNWEKVPNDLDAVLTYKGYTYFFKGDAYYRFNDRTFSVDEADPAFPRSTSYWWFGCRSASKKTLGNDKWNIRYPSGNSFFYGNLAKPGSKVNVKADHRDTDGDDFHDVYSNFDTTFNTGDTDEQLVTSSNQDIANSGSHPGGNHAISKHVRWFAYASSICALFNLVKYLVVT